MHATVFHGDLIPLEDFLYTYKDFPCLTVYIYSHCYKQHQEAAYYLHSIKQRIPWNCTLWIRRPTGRLCVDLMRLQKKISIDFTFLRFPVSESEATPLLAGSAPDIEVLVIDSLTLETYHEVCCWSLSPVGGMEIRPGITVHVGMIISRPVNNHFLKIASLPYACLKISSWTHADQVDGETMENGWTRFNVRDEQGTWLMILNTGNRTGEHHVSWLSQANHIFERCQITSGLEDYVLVYGADFCVTVPSLENVPAGFLFLCPHDDFRISTSSVGWPACPAYWSLDPSGTHRLSMEEANKAGFPEPQFTTRLWWTSWDSSVYVGLRKFYHAKGFDPYSQDVARHLGLPLYQPSGYVDPLFAHVVEEEDDSQEQDDPDSEMDVDYEAVENQDAEDLSDMDID
ncbi:hypothetical protein DFH06DRAFT_617144 [Mycena polygramma]|nr:hypothetical protein DFH06DRAFT_617144 [Mycena polygramma]